MILSFSKSSLEETKQPRLSLTNLRVQTSLQMNGGEGGGGERIFSMERKFTPTSVITLSNENNVWQEGPHGSGLYIN